MDLLQSEFPKGCFVIVMLVYSETTPYSVNAETKGNDLMDSTLMILQQIRTMIGGSVVFLECEHEPKLLTFYQNEHNRFHLYGERISADNIEYYQLLRLL